MVWLLTGLFLVLASIIITIMLKISSQVNESLKTINNSLFEANKVIGQNLGSTASIFGNVQESLGQLKESNERIYEISKDISSLQELLRAPKFRGQIGESMLENLLSQVLPKAAFQIQYRFKSQEAVDAVINLGGKLVPVDAKFSLENFQRYIDAEDEQLKHSFNKKFIQDVKNRIDEIASKYILPHENTYDFAFMYIPAENVYYEVIIKEDLFSYCISKKVIPVSPNTFYAYLQIICSGLRGFMIEDNAKAILKSLSSISVELDKFKEDFELLGKHLFNANSKYSDSQNKLARFSDRIMNIQTKDFK